MTVLNVMGEAITMVARPSLWLVKLFCSIVESSLSFAKRKPLGAVGLVLLVSMTTIGVFAPLIAPYDPVMADYQSIWAAPQWPHILGTDNFGRDVFSRTIMGARVSLSIALAALAVGVLMGSIIGLISGYFMGNIDLVLQRVVDSMMAFPSLILALALVAALGPSLLNVIIAISVVYIPRISRVVRASVISIKELQFVEAARAVGCSTARVLLLHVFPNVSAPLIVMATANLGQAIVLEASMSFVGLGVPPPQPSWGNMLTGAAQDFVFQAPWIVLAPGAAMTASVLGFNLFGDALRDILDPRQHGPI